MPYSVIFKILTLCLLTGLLLSVAPVNADTVNLSAIKDNTLYEEDSGSLSNGAGEYLFAGKTDGEEIRRGLVMFDLGGSGIEPGSAIDSVKLTLSVLPPPSADNGARTITLHRVLADWGEGTSVADDPGKEGKGGPATDGDATWKHTFYDEFDTDLWANLGGDFDATISADQVVDKEGSYTWGSTTQLIADVQAVVDGSAGNFGFPGANCH